MGDCLTYCATTRRNEAEEHALDRTGGSIGHVQWAPHDHLVCPLQRGWGPPVLPVPGVGKEGAFLRQRSSFVRSTGARWRVVIPSKKQ
jgi:hypothetical protein